MSESIRYGQTDSERVVEENTTARKIIREITNFGITERQRMMIIYLLAMELEDIEHMKAITSVVRSLGTGEIFIMDRTETEDG